MLTAIACALLVCGLVTGPVFSQSHQPYEYDPYRVVIWVAIEPSPLLPTGAQQVAHRLASQADQAFGAAWDVQGVACPMALARRVALAETVSWEEISSDKAVASADKLMLVALQATAGGGARAVVHEFDCRSRSVGEAITRAADQPENACAAALSALVAAFSPLVRLEGIENNQQLTRLRAGGLIVSEEESPAAIKPGDLLVPVVRRNDRNGEPRVGGLQRLPHTYLEVVARNGFDIPCNVHSGLRGAIPPKGNRIERFALRIRPQERGTRLVLKARDSDPPELVDYEVLARSPNTKNEPQLVGITDLRGAVQVPLKDEPLTMIYIRHGEQMLARIPLVPGLVEEQTIVLSSDDQRLLAESYYVAMQSTLMDLVARREVLAARIRLRLDNDDVKGAQDMLTELRTMTSRADLLKQLESQQLTYKSADKSLQFKVDKMFGELRKLLGKHLDPKLVDDLAAEVNSSKKA